jgi:4-hydroxy-tetrahydrodipicolinate reductase
MRNVAVSGLPGKMATLLAETIETDERFQLLALGLTGPDMGDLKSVQIGNRQIRICPPDERQEFLKYVLRTEEEELYSPVLIADFTHPNAVIENATFYAEHELPFVMGTTGGDRALLNQIVEQSRISAVIAPNMAAQVVALQAAIEYMAATFPDAFSGFNMEVTESHQQGKVDTSGTAKALITQFAKLGIPFDVNDVRMIREPTRQTAMGIA